MARFYADEDFDLAAVEALRRLGHDALTAQEAGQANRRTSDAEILAFAVGQGRAVLTFNRRHFIHLHRQAPAHRGIVVCTRDADPTALAHRIHQAVVGCADLDGQLLRVNRPLSPR